jgi:hypothetical protein
MTNGSATTGNVTVLSIADIEKVMRDIDLLPKNTDWFLMSPDGRAWKGKPEEMLLILMPYHPLLRGMNAFNDAKQTF